MVQRLKSIGAIALRLTVVLALLACPRVVSAQGTWSVISVPQQPGDVILPAALAADAIGNLYVADGDNGGRIQQRDAQGNWSVIATYRSALGQVDDPRGLAVDGAGNLFVADTGNNRVLEYTPAPGS